MGKEWLRTEKAGMIHGHEEINTERVIYDTADHTGLSHGDPDRGIAADAAMFFRRWHGDAVCRLFIYIGDFCLCHRAGGRDNGDALEFLWKTGYTGTDPAGRAGDHFLYHGADDDITKKDHPAGQSATGGFPESGYIKRAGPVFETDF